MRLSYLVSAGRTGINPCFPLLNKRKNEDTLRDNGNCTQGFNYSCHIL